MHLKLTDLAITHLKPASPQIDYWDTLLPSFGVRVGLRRKTFIVMLGTPRKRRTLGHYPLMNLQAARESARSLLASPNAPAAILVADAIDKYLRARTTRRRTTYEYERLLHRHLLPTAGHRKLTDLQPRDILAITDKLLRTPTECRHAHVAMQTFFNWCVPRYIAASPMAGLKTPTKPNKRDRVLTDDELKRIWRAADHLADFGKMVRLCILTGQRRGEISKILPEWLSADTMTIPAAVAKNKREHTIPLAPVALELAKHAPLTVGNWGRKKAELDEISNTGDWVLHDLRRTFSTNLAALQVHPHVIERILNHASGTISPLASVYNRHTYLAEMKIAMERYEHKLRELLSIA